MSIIKKYTEKTIRPYYKQKEFFAENDNKFLSIYHFLNSDIKEIRIKFPFWVVRKNTYSIDYDRTTNGWKVLVLVFRIRFSRSYIDIGKQKEVFGVEKLV